MRENKGVGIMSNDKNLTPEFVKNRDHITQIVDFSGLQEYCPVGSPMNLDVSCEIGFRFTYDGLRFGPSNTLLLGELKHENAHGHVSKGEVLALSHWVDALRSDVHGIALLVNHKQDAPRPIDLANASLGGYYANYSIAPGYEAYKWYLFPPGYTTKVKDVFKFLYKNTK